MRAAFLRVRLRTNESDASGSANLFIHRVPVRFLVYGTVIGESGWE